MAEITDVPGRNDRIVEEGNIPTESMFIWMSLLTELLQLGFTGTITTAALTGGGTTGTMTFQNGVLIDQVPAT